MKIDVKHAMKISIIQMDTVSLIQMVFLDVSNIPIKMPVLFVKLDISQMELIVFWSKLQIKFLNVSIINQALFVKLANQVISSKIIFVKKLKLKNVSLINLQLSVKNVKLVINQPLKMISLTVFPLLNQIVWNTILQLKGSHVYYVKLLIMSMLSWDFVIK